MPQRHKSDMEPRVEHPPALGPPRAAIGAERTILCPATTGPEHIAQPDEAQPRVAGESLPDLRARFEALVAAYRELGSEPRLAEVQARDHLLREKSAPAPRAGRRAGTRWWDAATIRATVGASALFGGFYAWHERFVASTLWGVAGIPDYVLYRYELFAAPILMGLIIGLLFPRRAVRGTLNTMLAIIAYTLIWPSLFAALDVTRLLTRNPPQWLLAGADGQSTIYGLFWWPFLGLTGAWAGSRAVTAAGRVLRRRRRGAR